MSELPQRKQYQQELAQHLREDAADRMSAQYELVNNPNGRILVPGREIKTIDEESDTYESNWKGEILDKLKGGDGNEASLSAKPSEAKEIARVAKPKKPRQSRPFPRCVRVFKPADIERVKNIAAGSASDVKRRIEAAIKLAATDGGYRQVPSFKNINRVLAEVKRNFGNFSEVLDHLSGEMILAGASRPELFRMTPILMNGPPGVGKTAIAQAVAEVFGLPYIKMSAGSLQHGFALSGSDSRWGNSQAGEVFKMIGGSKSASGIFIMDEVDKIDDRSDHAILPALLDLLEFESARKFLDVSLGLTFDASHLIILLTCNSIKDIHPALFSRCQVFNIAFPGWEQRVMIAKSEYEKRNRGLPRSRQLSLDIQAVERLAEADIDVRALIRSVVKGFTAALTQGRKVVVPILDDVMDSEKTRSIGFVWPESGKPNLPPKTDGGTLYCIGRPVDYSRSSTDITCQEN